MSATGIAQMFPGNTAQALTPSDPGSTRVVTPDGATTEPEGVSAPGEDGALALLGQLARLEREGLVGAADGPRDDDGFRHVCSSLPAQDSPDRI